MSQALAGPPSSPPGVGSTSKRAPRGAACLNCRRRKMKCDGARPICGQCVRAGREADCEYTDGSGPSPTQILEEQIARLEARIRELEHPELVSPSVTLNPANAPLPIQSPQPTILTEVPSIPLLGGVDTSDTSSLPMPEASGHGTTSALSQDPLVDPPAELVRNLVNTFLPHSSSLSFFLHVPRFTQALQLPSGDPRRAQLSPALLNAVYLWGAHLSPSNTTRAFESTFLTRVTNALSAALRDSHYTVMHLIQAEVLIANYFFSMSRFLEGRYHYSAAIALALSCRLTKIRSSADQGPHGRVGAWQLEHGRDHNLPPPRDAIEEGERIRGFWFVYALDKTWAVALGSPSHFNGITQSGAHVDTPWPLEMAQYEANVMPPDFRSSLTVLNFMSGGSTSPVPGWDSQLSLRVKAATLFERATHLASQWSVITDRNDFYSRFRALDGLIDRFTASLPPVDRSGSADALLTSIVTHTLAHSATIQLRSSLKDSDRINDRKDFAAAQAAAALLENLSSTLTHVDPILAILWTAVCRVLIGEMIRAVATRATSSSQPSFFSVPVSYSAAAMSYQQRLRPQPAGRSSAPASSSSTGAGPPILPPGQAQTEATIRTMLDTVLAAMNRFREASPLMAVHCAEVHAWLD